MRRKPSARTRVTAPAAVAAPAAVTAVLGLLCALAPTAVAAQAPLPLPLPAAESLVTEPLVTVEGPLINNLTLPMTK